MTDTTRRQVKGAGAGAAGCGAVPCDGATAQLKYTPEAGAKLRPCAGVASVHGDQLNANTAKFTALTGVEVTINGASRTCGPSWRLR
jgi:hypothetical protein